MNKYPSEIKDFENKLYNNKNNEALTILIENKENFANSSLEGTKILNNSLVNACSKGFDKIVKELLKIPTIDINIIDFEGNTPLMISCEYGYLSIVEQLIEANANVNIRNIMGNSALLLAIDNSHSDIAQRVLQVSEVDILTPNTLGFTTLMLASLNNLIGVVKTLLDKTSYNNDFINARNKKNDSALMMGIVKNNKDIVELLLAIPIIDLTSPYSRNWTTLMLASVQGFANITQMLINKIGAENTDFINFKNNEGNTAFILACMYDKAEIIKILLDVPNIDINIRNNEGKDGLFYASKLKSKVILFLIQQKLNPTAVMVPAAGGKKRKLNTKKRRLGNKRKSKK